MEPIPENVTGEIVQQHVFKHEINWGYVAVALVVLFVALKVLDSGGSDSESVGESDSGIIG